VSVCANTLGREDDASSSAPPAKTETMTREKRDKKEREEDIVNKRTIFLLVYLNLCRLTAAREEFHVLGREREKKGSLNPIRP